MNKDGMHRFRMAFYEWEFQDSDYCDAVEEHEMKAYAKRWVKRLMPSLDRVLNHDADLDADTEIAYLLTLLQAVTLADMYTTKSQLVPRIADHLQQLPESRLKTHLLTHLYINGCDDLFPEAYESASLWAPATLDDEDRYTLRFLQEEYDFAPFCPQNSISVLSVPSV